MSTHGKLVKLRRMGCMEQIFTCVHDKNIPWGCAVIMFKIPGIHKISLNKLQNIINKLHYKYECLQTQVLNVKNLHKYDIIYKGILPCKCVSYKMGERYQTPKEAYLDQLNSRFLLLNDFGLNEDNIDRNEYDINQIPTLYRYIRYHDHIIFNINHAIADGITMITIQKDFVKLLNNDYTLYKNDMIPYTCIEECIDKKYESNGILNFIGEYAIPTSLALWFGKVYSHNNLCLKYNPLGFYLHNDEILRFRYNYTRIMNTGLLAFPLGNYDKNKWESDCQSAILNSEVSLKIIDICKQQKAKVSSLMQYITNAAVIEAHNDILTKDYYKTVINNTFRTTPMYKKPSNIYSGMHSASYCTFIEYYKNAKANSDQFWDVIRKISRSLVTDERVKKIYKNKFPWLNVKRILNESWDMKGWFGELPFPPIISNPGLVNINLNSNWKYKAVQIFGGHNPGGILYIHSIN